MREVLLATGATITVTLISTVTSGPLAGIVPADITLYLRKAVGSPVEKTITTSNFREVDGTNLPGVYEIDFTSSDFSLPGELVFVIAENGGVNLEQYTETIRVGELHPDVQERYALTQVSGVDKTFTLDVRVGGASLEGLNPSDFETDLTLNGVSVTNTLYDSVSGLGQGLYAFTVPGVLASDAGDLLLRVRPFENITPEADGMATGSTSAQAVYAVAGARNQTQVLVADYLVNDVIRISTDRGETFDPVAYRSGGFTKRASGVDGNPSDPLVYVISCWEASNSVAFSYYTTDGGDTFTEAFDFLTQNVVSTGKVALEHGGNGYFMLAEGGTSNTLVFQGSLVAGALVTTNTFGANVLHNDVAFHKASTAVIVGEDTGVSDIQIYSGVNFGAATTVPNVGILHGVDMVRGGSEGWAVGAGGSVLYTTDDGDNWVDQSANIAAVTDLKGVYAIDSNTAYVVGGSGEIYRTEDAGATWFVPPAVTEFGASDNLVSTYLSDNTLFSVSSAEGVRYEEGKFFNQFDASLARIEVVSAAPTVTPEDEIKAYLNAELPRLRGPVTIPADTTQTVSAYFSLDGEANTGVDGATLTSLLFKAGVPAVNTINTTVTELNPSLFPGWYTFDLGVGDTNVEGDLVVDLRGEGTSISGADQTVPATVGTPERGIGVYAKSETEAFICIRESFGGERPLQTADGGTTWVQNATSTYSSADAVEGVEGTDFLCLGTFDSGVAYDYSDDFGVTWNQAFDNSFSVFDSINHMSAVSTDLVYATAGSYVVLWDRISDAGELVPVYDVFGNGVGSGSESFTSIYGIDASTAVAVGVDSTSPFIARSTDGGTSWTSITPGTAVTGSVNDVDFVGTVGWAVGDGGILLKSTDGGATFTDQTPPSAANLEGVYAVSSTTAWAVGSEALIYTTDGGTTWAVPPGGLADLMADRTGFSINGSGSEIWITGIDTSGSAEPFILNIDSIEVTFNPVTFRFFVATGGGAVDLTPVTDSLDEIKGVGFATGTDSLIQLRGNQDDMATSLTDIQGATFDNSTDSLEQIRDEITAMQGATFNTVDDSLEAISNSSATVDLTPVTDAIAVLSTDVSNLTADVSDLSTELGLISASVARLLGLSQENYRIVDQAYDSNNKLTTASVRLFGSKADTDANTNPVAVYAVTATYDTQGLLVDYKVTREV